MIQKENENKFYFQKKEEKKQYVYMRKYTHLKTKIDMYIYLPVIWWYQAIV